MLWAGSDDGPLRHPLGKPVIAAIEGHACAGGLGVALLFHVFAIGPVGTVSPIVAVTGCAMPVLAGLFWGERPGLLRIGAIAQSTNMALTETLPGVVPVPFDGATGDVFGRIYEYFLNKFAMTGAQEGGVVTARVAGEVLAAGASGVAVVSAVGAAAGSAGTGVTIGAVEAAAARNSPSMA